MTKRIEEQSAKLDQITEEQLKSGQIEVFIIKLNFKDIQKMVQLLWGNCT